MSTLLDEAPQATDQNVTYGEDMAKQILNSGGRIPIGVDASKAAEAVTNFLQGQREADDAAKQPAANQKQQTLVGHSSGAGDRHVLHTGATYHRRRETSDSAKNSGLRGFSVQGDTGFVDNVTHIQFTVADDPSAGYIQVEDGGGGVAIVYIPVIPPSPGGIAVLGDDDGATEWFPTDSCTGP